MTLGRAVSARPGRRGRGDRGPPLRWGAKAAVARDPGPPVLRMTALSGVPRAGTGAIGGVRGAGRPGRRGGPEGGRAGRPSPRPPRDQRRHPAPRSRPRAEAPGRSGVVRARRGFVAPGSLELPEGLRSGPAPGPDPRLRPPARGDRDGWGPEGRPDLEGPNLRRLPTGQRGPGRARQTSIAASAVTATFRPVWPRLR